MTEIVKVVHGHVYLNNGVMFWLVTVVTSYVLVGFWT